MKTKFVPSVVAVFSLFITPLFAQEKGIKINLDSLKTALEHTDIRTINDHAGKDFFIRQQTSRIEIFENGVQKYSIPAILYSYIDFQKFDSVRVELISINGPSDRSVLVKCYCTEPRNKNDIIELLKLNSSKNKKQ
jgi:hypothetical protein